MRLFARSPDDRYPTAGEARGLRSWGRAPTTVRRPATRRSSSRAGRRRLAVGRDRGRHRPPAAAAHRPAHPAGDFGGPGPEAPVRFRGDRAPLAGPHAAGRAGGGGVGRRRPAHPGIGYQPLRQPRQRVRHLRGNRAGRRVRPHRPDDRLRPGGRRRRARGGGAGRRDRRQPEHVVEHRGLHVPDWGRLESPASA